MGKVLTAFVAGIALPAGADPVVPAHLPPVVSLSSPISALDSAGIAGQSSSRYEAADLEVAHERGIDEVLRGEPGVLITKGGGNGAGLLYLRGSGGQGLLTLDGLPVPDTLPGVINLNALLPDGLQTLEVNRGFGPASRTFASLGGAVQLIPREAHDNSADLRVEGGSFGFLKETLRGNLAAEHARLAVTVNHSATSDGVYHAQKDNGNPERDPFHGTQALMKAGLDFSDALIWDGTLFYRDSWNAIDGAGIRNAMLAPVDENSAFFKEETWMAQNSLTARLGENCSSRLRLGYTHNRNRNWSMGLSLGYTTDLYLARWENEQKLWQGGDGENVRLVWGAEGRHENAHGPTYALTPAFTFVPGPSFAEARSQQAGFAETRFTHGKFSGDLGVHYEGYDRYGSHALFHAGAAWQVLPALKLRAGGGNGFRIPSYAEKLFPLLGNLNVKPERSAGGDLGLEWQALSRLKLNLTGYYNRYDDLILVSWSAQPSAALPCIGECLSNLPNATIAGMEAGSELVFNEHWRGGAAYTYTDSRNLANGRRVPFRAKNSARLWGEWQARALPISVWAEGLYRGKSYNDIDNRLIIGDAFRFNAQLSYRVSPKMNFYVRGENLGDDKTPDFFGLDYPGAAVYGGVELKL